MHGEWGVYGKGGTCVAKGRGMRGRDKCGKGACMQGRRPLKRTVRNLLECILVLVLFSENCIKMAPFWFRKCGP